MIFSMQVLRNTFDRFWAALIFFTRLPLWRIYQPGAESYRHVVEYWPMAGWVTGGTMMLVYTLVAYFSPHTGMATALLAPGGGWVGVLLIIGARVLLTGALHEDGLADFCDGLGGATPAHKLAIMKDSHIGTYGVIGLIGYFLFLYSVLPYLSPLLLLTADVWGKSVASLLVLQLPYARTEAEAKSKTIYVRYAASGQLLRIIVAMLPVVLLWWYVGSMPHWAIFLVPIAVELLLALWMKRHIGGYTGDCCGATFLLCEVSIYFTFLMI